MKTLRILISVCALTACALVAGCSKSKDNKPPSGVSGVTPEGRMEMQFKWIVGKRYVMRMNLAQDSETKVPNQPKPMKQVLDMTQDYNVSVTKELPDGGKELQLEFIGTKMEWKLADRTIVSFDSAQDAAGDARNPVAGMLRKMVGGRLKYTTTPEGRVEKVEGVDELVARVLQGAPPELKAGFGGMYNEGYFKQLCDVARMAPSRGVKPGDSWPLNFQDEMGPLGILVVDLKLKFEDWDQHGDRKCARIGSKGEITSKPAATVGLAPAPTAIEIEKGDMIGTSWFDPALGMVVDSVTDQKMTTKITTKGMVLTTQLTQKISGKLLDVGDAH